MKIKSYREVSVIFLYEMSLDLQQIFLRGNNKIILEIKKNSLSTLQVNSYLAEMERGIQLA